MIPVTYTSEYPTRDVSFACPGALVVLRPDSQGKVGIFSWGEFLGTPGKKGFRGGIELAIYGEQFPEGSISLEIRSEGNPRLLPYFGRSFCRTALLRGQHGQMERFQTFEEALTWAQKAILEGQKWLRARHLQEKEITLQGEVYVLVTPPEGGWGLYLPHHEKPFASLDAEGAFTLHIHRLPFALLPIADTILEAVEAALEGQDAKVG